PPTRPPPLSLHAALPILHADASPPSLETAPPSPAPGDRHSHPPFRTTRPRRPDRPPHAGLDRNAGLSAVPQRPVPAVRPALRSRDRKSTRLNSSHVAMPY